LSENESSQLLDHTCNTVYEALELIRKTAISIANEYYDPKKES